MKTSIAFTLAACAFASSALACQPPRDMPSDPAEAAQYWERARTNWERQVVTGAPILVVAKVDTWLGRKNEVLPPDAPHRFSLVAIKTLRGTPARPFVGVYSNHWCDDFKVGVAQGGVYLLAMHGERINVSVPLIEGREREGVAKFFERIGETNPWQ